jgi:hypothetical protein
MLFSSTESWKSLTSGLSFLPSSAHTASAAARQKSGMPMASGKSAAFEGQPQAV